MTRALDLSAAGAAEGTDDDDTSAHGALASRIAAALSGTKRDDALERLNAAGVPAAPAPRPERLFDDPYLAENHCFQQWDDPEFGRFTVVGDFAAFGRSSAGFARRAPLLGEHSAEVLREFGFDEAAIAALTASGVVAQA